jgi:hypothetical protein
MRLKKSLCYFHNGSIFVITPNCYILKEHFSIYLQHFNNRLPGSELVSVDRHCRILGTFVSDDAENVQIQLVYLQHIVIMNYNHC